MTPVGQADTDSWQQVGLNSSRPKSSVPIKKGRTCKMARHDKLYTWMRYLMLLLCVILVISGFVLLGLGAWIRYGAATFVDVLGSYSSQLIYISYICIGMGSVLSFTGLIGCCGAWKENRFFIMLFFFIVTMLFVAEIIGTIFVLTYRNLFKCCGFENSTVDFKGSVFSTTTGLNYPKTCCVNKTLADCDGITITPSLIQPQSCFGKVITVIREQSVILGSAAGCICMMELSSMILAMVLFVKLGLMRHPW
ncbi:tetraspanin-1-like isoform X2 [Salvelinus namaycush]|uniref:Tetraspanin-1-like isoform X2 n=1 Tax=Salvelinus namaycush TaxID=8040 RepID=A0A8U0UAN2_SALNM|nr:tetraspanin-1-like isoform X2 [Salvelinus namaycush]